MTIRRALPEDAPLLANHRANVWHEVGDWSRTDLERQVPHWIAFFRTCLAEETYIAFIAEIDGRAIASGGLLVYLTIPRPGSNADRSGRVQSVYVEPQARRNGVARAIMTAILAAGRAYPLVAITLHPSDEARGLYASLGFTAADEMTLSFIE